MSLASVISAIMSPVVDATAGLTWSSGRDIGSRAAQQRTDMPRVLWIPRGFERLAAEKVSSGPRMLSRRAWKFDVEVWAETFDAVETILDQLERSLYAEAAGRFDLSDASTDEERSFTARGELVTVQVSIEMIVLAGALTTATIAEVQTEGAAQGDGVIHVGET